MSAGWWLGGLFFAAYASTMYLQTYGSIKHMTAEEVMGWISWWPAIIASSLYILTVNIAPKFVTQELTFGDRLKDVMLAYNVYQVVINAWWCYAVITEVFFVLQEPVIDAKFHRGTKGFNLAFLMWVHYNNKFIELLDSAFMILRNKSQQLSFLHCFHHVMIMWAWVVPCKLFNGGDIWFGAWANSFIHVLMYGYYFLAAIKVPCPWKKQMTQMQLAQFCICFAHATMVLWYNSVPWHIAIIQHCVMIAMLIMFRDFYKKSYASKKSAAGGEKMNNQNEQLANLAEKKTM